MKKLYQLLLVALLIMTNITFTQAQESQEEYNNTYQKVELNVDVPKVSNHKLSRVQIEQLPTRYDSRDYGYVTSVKNQGELGLCWAYSTMAVAETSVLKNKLASIDDLDFSEHHLAYFYFHRQNDPLNLTGNDNNTIINETEKNYLIRGGNCVIAAFFLSQWGGVIDEDLAPLKQSLDEQEAGLDPSLAYGKELFYMKDAIFLPSMIAATKEKQQEIVKEMKQLLVKYGALSSSYNSITDPTTGNTLETICPYLYVENNYSVNHAITIVGYDDSIKKEMFYPNTPSQDGAWIVKNSWGNFHGSDEGYFYISYDYALDVIVAFDYMDTNQYDHNYFYDGTSSLNSYNSVSNDSIAKIANVFTAQNDEFLKAISIGIKSINTDYEIQIYKNLTDLNDPESGEAMLTMPTKGSKELSGIYTIPLNEAVSLNKGDTFSVVVTLENKNQDVAEYYIAGPFNDGYMNHEEEIKEQQSFFEFYGTWYDFSKNGFNSCARIKALTADKVSTGIDIATTQVQLEYDEMMMNGSNLEPDVMVFDENKQLVQGKDYFVEYNNNINPGLAEVIITGINDYSGQKIVSFEIIENKQTVTVSASLNEEESGFVLGSGTYQIYDVVEVEAYANCGYSFDGWMIDGVMVSHNPKYRFKVTKDTVITPCFKQDVKDLIAVNGIVNDLQGGVISGCSYYEKDSYIVLKAIANKGYDFVGWYINNQFVESDDVYTFTVSESITIEARFEKQKEVKKVNVTATCCFPIVISGVGEYNEGDEVVLSVDLSSSLIMKGWEVNGEIISTDTSCKFIASEDVEVILHVSEQKPIYKITSTVNDPRYGSIRVIDECLKGDSIQLNAEVNEYCEFVGWEVDGEIISTKLNDTYIPTKDTTMKAIFKYVSPFSDVIANQWYEKSVENAHLAGLMGALNGDQFGPDVYISRAMVATVLYRMDGQPNVNAQANFSDVKANLWYTKAISWASENKVVSGYKDGRFGCDDNITRQDLAIMLRNYAKAKGLNTNKVADLSHYADVKDVDSYATSAIAWCVEQKIISGSTQKDGTYLNPKNNATRAECAKMFTLLNDLLK